MDIIYDGIRHWFQICAQRGILPDAFQYGFIINSLLCAALIGPILGMLGTVVLVKRMAFFSSAIGNAAITGIAIGIICGEPVSAPYICLISFALLFAITLNFSYNRTALSRDALISVFLSASLAIGAALMFSVTRKINIHLLDSFLFGSILTASYSDITFLLIAGSLALGGGLWYFNRFMLSGISPQLAGVRGVQVVASNYIFVILIALITVASIKIVGAILVEALLIIPAAAARNVCRSLRSFVFTSVVLATFSAIAGVLLPVMLNISVPSGGAIIIIASGIFAVSIIVRMIKVRF